MSVIVELAPLLLVTALLGVIMTWFRLPPLLGYLLTGIIAEAGGFGPLVPTGVISWLGELGIVLLLFYLGLELSWRKVAAVAGLSSALALVSIGLPFLVLYNVLLVTGAPAGHPALVAFVLSINSTALGVQALEGQGKLTGRLGLLVVGVSLVVDIAVIVALALFGVASPGHELGAGELVLRLVGFTAACATIGVAVIPRLLDAVHGRPSSRLVLPVALIALGLGVAWAGHLIGVPESVGAFLAGSLAAEARCRRDLEGYLHPVKELFIAFFFLAVGFQITLPALQAALPLALGLGLLMLIVRPIVVSTAAWLLNEEGDTALALGAALLPIGEFSFLLVKAAGLPEADRDLLLALVGLILFGLALFAERGVARAPALHRRLHNRTPPVLDDLLVILRASLGRWLSPYEARNNTARTALRDLGLTLAVILGLGVALAGTAAWLDGLLSHLLPVRDIGRFVGAVLFVPLIVVAWGRWQKLLDALFGREHTGPGSERVRRIQRTMRAALSALAAGLAVLLLLPVVSTLLGSNRLLLTLGAGVPVLILAFLFRGAIVRLHDLLEGEMRGRSRGADPPRGGAGPG